MKIVGATSLVGLWALE